MTPLDPAHPDAPQPTRDELIAMVARAHGASAYGETALAGRALAAQSRLPKVIAENLGGGIGQWSFFPEAVEIVDFALAYVPPATEADVWSLARTWASDDAASRPTLMALVGREIVQHELKRIEVPSLRALFDEWRPARALALRTSLGLDVPAARATKGAAKPKPIAETKPVATAKAAPTATPPAAKREIPTRMPKPTFVPPPKREAAPPAKRFEHPKFGIGVLEKQDGEGPEAKLTLKFEGGSKTLLARYLTEIKG